MSRFTLGFYTTRLYRRRFPRALGKHFLAVSLAATAAGSVPPSQQADAALITLDNG